MFSQDDLSVSAAALVEPLEEAWRGKRASASAQARTLRPSETPRSQPAFAKARLPMGSSCRLQWLRRDPVDKPDGDTQPLAQMLPWSAVYLLSPYNPWVRKITIESLEEAWRGKRAKPVSAPRPMSSGQSPTPHGAEEHVLASCRWRTSDHRASLARSHERQPACLPLAAPGPGSGAGRHRTSDPSPSTAAPGIGNSGLSQPHLWPEKQFGGRIEDCLDRTLQAPRSTLGSA